jgi:3-oxoacyl-[acyl-carrier-protein] synthase-1
MYEPLEGPVRVLGIADYSVCCALGLDKASVAQQLFAGKSGLRASPFGLPFATLCGSLPEAPAMLPEAVRRFDTRQARLASLALGPVVPALARCVERYGAERVAIALGSSNAGLDTTERHAMHASDAMSLHTQHELAAVLVLLQELTGVRGHSVFVSTACSSAGKAFASAARLLDAGLADAVLVGGVDALCEMTVRGFRSLGVLAEGACKPLSSERAGINIGEGAAFFVLERASHPLVLRGWGETADAHHMTAPHPEGEGAERVMREALERAALPPSDVDLINAHGTATAQGDASEALAIGRVFGQEVPVVSTKAYTGHALGAAGAIEAALCLLTLEHGIAPASLGATPLDPKLPIRVLEAAERGRYRNVLSNSFAFGGSNVSVIFGRSA